MREIDTNNLTGQKFGEQLQVIGEGIRSAEYTFWKCSSCACGNLREGEEKRLLSSTVTKCLECEAKCKPNPRPKPASGGKRAQ